MLRPLRILPALLFVLFIGAVVSSAGLSAAEPRLGLVEKKPTCGRFVKTDQGYMVPYQAKIPGTKIIYSMEPIPGGTFLLGSPKGEENRSDDEGPQIEVTIEPFWMGKYEVTWGEYHNYMDLYDIFLKFQAKKIRKVTPVNRVDAVTTPTPLHQPSVTYESGNDPSLPAVSMTQFGAMQYTKWLSGITSRQYRLPSEAEWEYACRAGTKTAYFFGDDADKLGEYAWYYDNSNELAMKVGLKKPNPWGLYDVHGNVWEWVLDAYQEEGYQRLAGKKVSAKEAVDWPTKSFPLALRGGGWGDDAERCRSAARFASESDDEWKASDPNGVLSPWWFADEPTNSIGFRIVRSLQVEPKEKMARYWTTKTKSILTAVDMRLGSRGIEGISDKDLPAAIQKLRGPTKPKK